MSQTDTCPVFLTADSTFFFFKALLQAIDVLKREVQRQREEKEVLEANVREQVVSEMMEVITGMQDGFRCVCICVYSALFKSNFRVPL